MTANILPGYHDEARRVTCPRCFGRKVVEDAEVDPEPEAS